MRKMILGVMLAVLAGGASVQGQTTATAPATGPATTLKAGEFKAYVATDKEGLTKAAENAEGATVSGTVKRVDVSSSGKVAVLVFEGVEGKEGFTAVYFTKQFAAMEKKFGGTNGVNLAGKKVRVSGQMEMFKGRPEMVLRKAEQVEVVE